MCLRGREELSSTALREITQFSAYRVRNNCNKLPDETVEWNKVVQFKKRRDSNWTAEQIYCSLSSSVHMNVLIFSFFPFISRSIWMLYLPLFTSLSVWPTSPLRHGISFSSFHFPLFFQQSSTHHKSFHFSDDSAVSVIHWNVGGRFGFKKALSDAFWNNLKKPSLRVHSTNLEWSHFLLLSQHQAPMEAHFPERRHFQPFATTSFAPNLIRSAC